MNCLAFQLVGYEGYFLITYGCNETQHISKNTAKADVLRTYKMEKQKLKSMLQSIPGRICLTSYLWT